MIDALFEAHCVYFNWWIILTIIVKLFNLVANLTCQIPATIHMGEIVMTLVTIHHSPMNMATRRGEKTINDTLAFKFLKTIQNTNFQ